MKKIILAMVMIIMFSVISIQDVSAKTFPFKYITEPNKEWIVTLSEPVDKDSVNADTVYIEYLNEKVKIEVTYEFNEDFTQIKVLPKESYELGYFMLLVIDNIKNVNGEYLNEKTTLQFNYVKKEDAEDPFFNPDLY